MSTNNGKDLLENMISGSTADQWDVKDEGIKDGDERWEQIKSSNDEQTRAELRVLGGHFHFSNGVCFPVYPTISFPHFVLISSNSST